VGRVGFRRGVERRRRRRGRSLPLGLPGHRVEKTVAAVAASPASLVEKWAWAFNGGPGLVSAQLETNKRSVSSSVLG
jgi:hypothetical protein